MLKLLDEFVENIAHGGIAQAHGTGHLFEAAARLDKVDGELLLFLTESGQRWQVIFAAHFGAAGVAEQLAHF